MVVHIFIFLKELQFLRDFVSKLVLDFICKYNACALSSAVFNKRLCADDVHLRKAPYTVESSMVSFAL